jgi:polyferredoxin
MEIILLFGFIILTMILWIWAISDIIRSRFIKSTMKIVWLAIVLFFPILGSIIYFQLRRKLINKEPRKFQPDFIRSEY